MNIGKATIAKSDGWARVAPRYDAGLGDRLTIGIVGLATDRAGVWDFEQFLSPLPGVGIFSTRIPMAEVATPQTLKGLGKHLSKAAELILPNSKVDVFAFSCTTGSVAVGLEAVHAAFHAVRPDALVSTPVEAAVKALHKLKARRISLLTPYFPKTGDLIVGNFRANGLEILSQATFDLGGDLDMNRLSGKALLAGARAVLHPEAEALFISCTGLRTSPVVQEIEDAIGVPVVTSNQALAWDSIRQGGVAKALPGRGKLFRV